jgi:glucose dehydrogenase
MNTATLHTSSNGQTVTGNIVIDGETVDSFQVKDGAGIVRRIDRKLSDLMWNRSGFDSTMTATLTRPATYTLLTTINAR